MSSGHSDESAEEKDSTDILYFDGSCEFCSGSVRFMKQRMHPNRKLKFVGLHTEEGMKDLASMPDRIQKVDSVILQRSGRTYIRSAAGIRAVLHLRQPWPLLFPLGWIIPLPIRDLGYVIIAKLRHKLHLRKMNS